MRLPVCGPTLELTFKSTLYLDFFVARPTLLTGVSSPACELITCLVTIGDEGLEPSLASVDATVLPLPLITSQCVYAPRIEEEGLEPSIPSL